MRSPRVELLVSSSLPCVSSNDLVQRFDFVAMADRGDLVGTTLTEECPGLLQVCATGIRF
jgi:hypothetical protein